MRVKAYTQIHYTYHVLNSKYVVTACGRDTRTEQSTLDIAQVGCRSCRNSNAFKAKEVSNARV